MLVAVVQSLSPVQLFKISRTAAHQASLSLLKLSSIDSVMPSNHLILWNVLGVLFFLGVSRQPFPSPRSRQGFPLLGPSLMLGTRSPFSLCSWVLLLICSSQQLVSAWLRGGLGKRLSCDCQIQGRWILSSILPFPGSQANCPQMPICHQNPITLAGVPWTLQGQGCTYLCYVKEN